MARVFYERRNDLELGNDSNDNAFKPYACTAVSGHSGYSGYRLRRSCNLQRPFVVQRRPPRHLLEAWYSWLGIALLVVSVIFSVFYLVDVTHLSTVIDETIGNSISRPQEPIKTRYL